MGWLSMYIETTHFGLLFALFVKVNNEITNEYWDDQYCGAPCSYSFMGKLNNKAYHEATWSDFYLHIVHHFGNPLERELEFN